MKQVSIIILSYNSLNETTKPCIESIYNVKTRCDFETVVVDNLSTDGTREYLTSIENSYPNLKVILNDKNSGYAGGNNIGIKSSEAKYYILLNNDTIVTDYWMDNIVEFFEDHSEVGMVGPVSNSVGNEQRIYTDKLDEENIIEDGIRWSKLCSGDYFYTEMLGFFCVAIKNEVFKNIGYLDETFGIGMFEDDDFCMRAIQAGYKLACLEYVFIYHKGSVSFNKLGEKYNQLLFENLAKFESKHNVKWRTRYSNRSFVQLIEHYLDVADPKNIDKTHTKIRNKLAICKEFHIEPLDNNVQYLLTKKNLLDQIESSKAWKLIKKYYYIRDNNKVLSFLYKILRIIRREGLRALFSKIRIKINKKLEGYSRRKIFDQIKKDINNKRVIIFPTPLDWNIPLFQRPQQLAKAYSKKKDTVVIYFSDRHEYDHFEVADKVMDNLWLIGSNHVLEVNKLLEVSKEVIVSISWTGNMKYLDVLSYDKLIYEYIDELSLFTGYSEKMIQDHHDLLKKADVSVATATRLFEEIKDIARNPILSPNAGDYDFFSVSKNVPINIEVKDKINNYDCILGYYGALANWFDYDLVKEVALKKTNWAWILVGYDYDGSIKKSGILELPNVINIGAQHYSKLPSFLNAFDIATLPFKINEITLSTSPVKIFEYMAGGKPVVSSNLPECKKYKSVMTFNNGNEFIHHCEQILKLDTDDHYWNVLEKEANENTWDARTDQILSEMK